MEKKISYSELTIGFMVILMFVVSVSVALLSHRTDKVENKVDHIENIVNSPSHQLWK